MRADRMVAILMLLQTRDRVTTAEVARELEISERTARRDLDALGQAGLPVYSQPGRNGGWHLLGDGRTDLSGLTAAEARALFLVAGPVQASARPASPALKGALRKLLRALPEPMRDQANAAAQAIVVDPAGWDRATTAVPRWLDDAQRAVIDGMQIDVNYVARDRTATTRRVHPLGLAAKGSVWYLVADTDRGLRTFRVDRIVNIDSTDEAVVRPDGFNLEEAWKLIADRVDAMRTPVTARAVIAPTMVGMVRSRFGVRVRIGGARPDGHIEIELRGHHEHGLAAELAGFGGSVEVLEPAGVRDALAAIGAELWLRYRPLRAR